MRTPATSVQALCGEGRYKSSPIESEAYLLARKRYSETKPILTQHPLYASLDTDAIRRQWAYRELFNQALTDRTLSDIRLALNQTQPFGNRRFFDAVEQVTGQRREVKRRVRTRKPSNEGDLRSSSGQNLRT